MTGPSEQQWSDSPQAQQGPPPNWQQAQYQQPYPQGAYNRPPRGPAARFLLPLIFVAAGFGLLALAQLIGWPTYGMGVGRARAESVFNFLGYASIGVGGLLTALACR